MFLKSTITFAALSLLAASGSVDARMRILERDGRVIYPRRFGQENPAVLADLANACGGGVCATLAGRAISTLLALSPECAQQDLADDIIDASKNEDAATAARMVELAITFRQAEKNTPPDFTTNPPTLRNSVFCQKAPRNPELNGLVQAQDPGNDPDIFFDPALRASVQRGSQANTAPFGGAAAAPPAAEEPAAEEPAAEEPAAEEPAAEEPAAEEPAAEEPAVEAPAGECPAQVTVTVTADAPAANPTADAGAEAPEPAVTPPATPAAGNLQQFTGQLGGVVAPVVSTLADGRFQVENNAAFQNLQSALVRSCDVQNNQCANAANASGNRDFTVAQCNQQQAQCIAQARA